MLGLKEGDIVSIYSHPTLKGYIGKIVAIDLAKNPFEFHVKLNATSYVHIFTYRQLSKYHAQENQLLPDKETPWKREYLAEFNNGLCLHEYKLYTGMIEQFEYCIRCDKKK